MCLDLAPSLFHSDFPTKTLWAFLFSPLLVHSLPISLSLVWPPEQYKARNINYLLPVSPASCYYLLLFARYLPQNLL
jgi:hypothetical protein